MLLFVPPTASATNNLVLWHGATRHNTPQTTGDDYDIKYTWKREIHREHKLQPETAQEKPLAPRVQLSLFNQFFSDHLFTITSIYNDCKRNFYILNNRTTIENWYKHFIYNFNFKFAILFT